MDDAFKPFLLGRSLEFLEAEGVFHLPGAAGGPAERFEVAAYPQRGSQVMRDRTDVGA